MQRLALKLFHRQAKFTEVPIGLVAPARDAAHFTLLARERLGGLALPEAVRAIAVDAGDVVPLVGEALALFDDGASSPGDWQKLVERLRARLGGVAVHGLAVAADHRPERARRGKARSAAVSGRGRPVRLAPVLATRAPEPLAEIDAAPHRGGPLKLLAGPERIESGWWDGSDVTRDYFVAELRERALVWIYRERHAPGGWFLHGFLLECFPLRRAALPHATSASCAARRIRRSWSSARSALGYARARDHRRMLGRRRRARACRGEAVRA